MKKMQEAVKSGDVEKVREIIIKRLTYHPEKAETIEAVTYAMANTPGLFEPDNGVDTEVGTTVNDAEAREIAAEALRKNFSEEKLLAFVKLCTEKKEETVGDETEILSPVSEDDIVVVEEDVCRVAGDSCEDTEDDTIAALAASADRIMAEESESSDDTASENILKESSAGNHNEVSKSNPTKTLGIVLMVLGVICSIVGVSIPVMFMIGLGIGIFMLGTVLVVTKIRN